MSKSRDLRFYWSRQPNAEEIRMKISAANKAHHARYWLGRIHSEETKIKISLTKKASMTTVRGTRHHNWKGGVTSEHSIARKSLHYRTWRDAVYRRDGWRCIICGDRHNLVAHHIKSFSEHRELRFDIANGQTLCRSCHANHHGVAYIPQKRIPRFGVDPIARVERERESRRRYYFLNRGHILAYQTQRYRNDPERFRAYRRLYYQRVEKKKLAMIGHT